MIVGCICANKWKDIMWMTTRIHEHCKIMYTWPTADMGSLAWVSLQSGVLGLDMVSHRDWPPGARWGNGPQWLLARKQKRQRCKALKITQHGMIKRSYGSIWQSPFVSMSLSHISQVKPLLRNKVGELCSYKEVSCLFLRLHYGHSSSMPIQHLSLHYTSRVCNTWLKNFNQDRKQFGRSFF